MTDENTNREDASEFARHLVKRGSPEALYEVAEAFPVGSPERVACMKIAAVLARTRQTRLQPAAPQRPNKLIETHSKAE